MNDDKIRISPDALIAMIVTEAQDRELAQMPSLEEMNEDFQPSEKFQRKMEALVHDTKRKAERKKRLLDIKRFFITLTAAISIFSCTMLPVKAVREAVITTLIEWHDKFVSIIYVNEESPVSTFHITPSYIPSGFSQIESSGESTGHYYGQFQNSAGDWFSLRVFPVENAIQMDKDTMVFAFQIDDVTFFLFVVRQYPSDGSLYFFLLARNCLQVLRPKGTCRFPIENIPYNESVPRIMFNKREPIISAG